MSLIGNIIKKVIPKKSAPKPTYTDPGKNNPDAPQTKPFTPAPSPSPSKGGSGGGSSGGGSSGGGSPQQFQSIPPEFGGKQSTTPELQARQSFAKQSDIQKAVVSRRSNTVSERISQRTGRVESTNVPSQQLEPIRSVDVGTPQQERVGGVTFRGRDVSNGRTRVRNVGGGQVQVEIVPEETEEAQFQRGQQSATDFVFGGGISTGGALVLGSEIGKKGEEANQVFSISNRPTQEYVNGQPLYSGSVSAVTPSDLLVVTPVGLVRRTGAKFLFKEGSNLARVNIFGVTEMTGAATVRTEAIYSVESSGRFIKGIASAESIQTTVSRSAIFDLKGGGGAIINKSRKVIATGAKTQQIRTTLEIPTGRILTKPTGKILKSAEISTVKQRGNLYFTRSIGRSGRERFIAGGVSQRKGDLIIQFGGTIGKKGNRAISTGVFKIKTLPSRATFISTKGGGLTTQQTSSELTTTNLQAIRNAITKSAEPSTIKPLIRTSLIPVEQTKTSVPISQVKLTSISSQLKTSTKQFQVTIPIQLTSQTTIQRTTQRTRTIQTQTPSLQQKVVTIPKQTQTTKQNQRVVSIPKFLQKQKTSSRVLNLRFPSVPKPKTPLASFKLKPSTQTRQTPYKFPILVRRFGKFRIVGFGSTPREAVNIGSNIVSRTLARTFKVSGVTNVRGYKTKKEKEGLVFIEPASRALGTRSEVAEIQGYLKQSVKGGRR